MDDQVPLHQYSPRHSCLPPDTMDSPHPEIYTDRSNIVEVDSGRARKRKSRKSYDIGADEDLDVINHKHYGLQNPSQTPAENVKRIDYVLVYPCKYAGEIHEAKEKKNFQRNLEMRKKFEAALRKETLELQEDVIGENVFIKIHSPFERLCHEAEKVNLEMPLRGRKSEWKSRSGARYDVVPVTSILKSKFLDKKAK